jgi:hypothetical protein
MNKTLYEQTLQDLELRHARCLDEIARIERAVVALRESLDIPPILETVSVSIARPKIDPKQYADISVRWAVLKLLAENPARSLKTADIADTLTDGGSPRASKTNVSAVISDMVNKRSELEQTDDGYRLTESGRMAWRAIEHSARYANRANVPSAS